MNPHTLLLYSVASLALAVIPGPTMLLTMSNGITGGMRHALWGIGGALVGSGTLIALVALGLGSLFAASRWLFETTRIVGVGYLFWLGIQLWRSKATDFGVALATAESGVQQTGRRVLLRSLIVALSNPKTFLFFAAFLPQFVDVKAPQGMQYLLLGTIFIALDGCVMLAYAAAGMHAVRWLSRRSVGAINRGCAVGMWCLAASLAIWRRPA